MTIKNQTRKTTLANEVIIPTSIPDQALGLIKHEKPVAMLFKTRWGLHTFLMRYPIDVLVLNQANNVVAFKENLKPNQIFVWNPKYMTVIELPSETIKKTRTKLCDKISFQ